jgi:hypothetical protein
MGLLLGCFLPSCKMDLQLSINAGRTGTPFFDNPGEESNPLDYVPEGYSPVFSVFPGLAVSHDRPW